MYRNSDSFYQFFWFLAESHKNKGFQTVRSSYFWVGQQNKNELLEKYR